MAWINASMMTTLGALGLIPFAIGAVLHLLGRDLFGVDALWLFVSYSAIILSFLAGTLWGRSLSLQLPWLPATLLLASNALALLAWAALLWSGPAAAALLSLLLGYCLIFAVETVFRDALFAGECPPGYLRLRAGLTAVVVLLHLLLLGESL